jgi:P-type Cu+ transporter
MRASLHGVGRDRNFARYGAQNLFGAFVYNTLGIPLVAGVLYPFFGLLLNPMIAGGRWRFPRLP